MKKIENVEQLRQEFPGLVKAVEDQVLKTLGVGPEARSFTEEERLSDEERSKIRTSAKLAAGIDL